MGAVVYKWIACAVGWMLLAACQNKVEFGRIGVNQPLFKSYWFERERTIYVFYHFAASERIMNRSILEYRVDQESWTAVSEAPLVQLHEKVDCGNAQACGSFSLETSSAPSTISMRFRYDQDGNLADEFLSFPTHMRQVPNTLDRSFFVYGVFDQDNEWIQWRGRNAFPGLEHETVQKFGLVRPFDMDGLSGHDTSTQINAVVPSSYGIPNPCSGNPLPAAQVAASRGEDRWFPTQIPGIYPEACATAHSQDANGAVAMSALARKNPVVQPVENDLSLKFSAATLIPLVFASCEHGDKEYLDFQKDRLLIGNHDTDICLESDNYTTESVRQLMLQKIAAARRGSSRNLALVIILHYTREEDAAHAEGVIADALALVLNDAVNPRVAATFVYDSFAKTAVPVAPKPAVIWCPTLDVVSNTINSCRFNPARLVVGQLEVRITPLLPDYPSYQELDEQQRTAMKIKRFAIITPAEPTALDRLDIFSDVVAPKPKEGAKEKDNEKDKITESATDKLKDLSGGFWVFHPDDLLNLPKSESISYCAKNDSTLSLAYRLAEPGNQSKWGSPDHLISLAPLHNDKRADHALQLGIWLPFPFFLTVEYENTVALGPKGLTGYLAIKNHPEVSENLGAAILNEQRVPFRKVISRCTAFCKHPAFDDTGTYLLGRAWDTEFATQCYEPLIPTHEEQRQ